MTYAQADDIVKKITFDVEIQMLHMPKVIVGDFDYRNPAHLCYLEWINFQHILRDQPIFINLSWWKRIIFKIKYGKRFNFSFSSEEPTIKINERLNVMYEHYKDAMTEKDVQEVWFKYYDN